MMQFLKTQVRDVMQAEVCTIGPDEPVQTALERMYGEKISALVVDLADEAKGFGILTQKDVLGILADEEGLGGIRVSDAMTHPMVVLNPDYDLETAIRLMRMLGIRRAAVVDGSKLVGVVSFTDIFRYACQAHLDSAKRKSA
jgi:CBS domain-containing protein